MAEDLVPGLYQLQVVEVVNLAVVLHEATSGFPLLRSESITSYHHTLVFRPW